MLRPLLNSHYLLVYFVCPKTDYETILRGLDLLSSPVTRVHASMKRNYNFKDKQFQRKYNFE